MRRAAFAEDLRSNAVPKFLALHKTPRENLSWATVILSAHVLDEDGRDDSVIKAVIEEAQQFRKRWRKALTRRGVLGRGGTRWAGVIEIDLLHPQLMGGEARKQRLLHEVFEVAAGSISRRQRVAVIHFHAVVDGRGHDRSAWADDLRREWPGPWRVKVKPMFSEASVSENLERLGRYSTKVRLSYSEAWEGRLTRFHLKMEQHWQERVMALYEAMGVDSMVSSNVKSRAKKAQSKCIAKKKKAPKNKQHFTFGGPVQLMASDEHRTEESDKSRSHNDYTIDESEKSRSHNPCTIYPSNLDLAQAMRADEGATCADLDPEAKLYTHARHENGASECTPDGGSQAAATRKFIRPMTGALRPGDLRVIAQRDQLESARTQVFVEPLVAMRASSCLAALRRGEPVGVAGASSLPLFIARCTPMRTDRG